MAALSTSFSAAPATSVNTLEYMRTKAQELEGIFLNTLVKEMFSSVKSEGEIGSSYAQETWRGMQSEQFAAAMARSGGIGIADQIMRSLISQQERASAPAANPALATSINAYRGES